MVSSAQAKFWLLRAPSLRAAILHGSWYQKQACSTHFEQFACQFSQCRDCPIFSYEEMRTWEVCGDGRYRDGNSSFGRDGDTVSQVHSHRHNQTPSCRYRAHTEEHHTVMLMPSLLFPQRTDPTITLFLVFVCTPWQCTLWFAPWKLCFPK